MRQIVESVIQHYYEINPQKITPLGGGFYGRVFLAEIANAPFKIIVKIYLFPHLACREACQLKLLSAHSTAKMPSVYFVHNATNNIPSDAVIMEYIPGLNAGDSKLEIQEDNKNFIAEQIIDNLLAYHHTINAQGFGEINAESFEPDWKKWYKNKADGALLRTMSLHRNGKIDDYILDVAQKAHRLYDKIFYLPISKARLIHGDYNTWNILLDENLTHVSGVIDPFNCCWADSELDLYQLNNANGKYYGLLDLYASKFSLSENFRLKMSFYELFSEITHVHDANVKIDMARLTHEAKALERQMKYFGVL